MHNPQSRQFTLQSFSNYGKKLLQTHQGLKQIAKRIDITNRKVCYNPNRQPRPPCYHPGAARKEVPIKKSSSFLSTSRDTSNRMIDSESRVQSEFKYEPNFAKVITESPSWSFSKATKRQNSRQKLFKICSKNPLLSQSLQKQTEQTQPNESNIEDRESFQRKEGIGAVSSEILKTPLKRGFRFLHSQELTQTEINYQPTNTFYSCRGYVNMLTQTSRPKMRKQNHSCEFQSTSTHNFQCLGRIHNFQSYVPRKEAKAKPMPQYPNLSYKSVHPKIQLGYINPGTSRTKPTSKESLLINSLSFMDIDTKSPKRNTRSHDFQKMTSRKQSLFPNPNLNLKKKGDSSILRILKQASKYRNRPNF